MKNVYFVKQKDCEKSGELCSIFCKCLYCQLKKTDGVLYLPVHSVCLGITHVASHIYHQLVNATVCS